MGRHDCQLSPVRTATRLAPLWCILVIIFWVGERSWLSRVLPLCPVFSFFLFSSVPQVVFCRPSLFPFGFCPIPPVFSWLALLRFFWPRSFPCHTSFCSSPFRGLTLLIFVSWWLWLFWSAPRVSVWPILESFVVFPLQASPRWLLILQNQDRIYDPRSIFMPFPLPYCLNRDIAYLREAMLFGRLSWSILFSLVLRFIRPWRGSRWVFSAWPRPPVSRLRVNSYSLKAIFSSAPLCPNWRKSSRGEPWCLVIWCFWWQLSRGRGCSPYRGGFCIANCSPWFKKISNRSYKLRLIYITSS